ncbi:MAG TPA: hypothetical protein VD710_04355 [Nitrososphaeraceae archaeon]|nr:hypothetical protein [Nitrososphaeraceae archaeon]
MKSYKSTITAVKYALVVFSIAISLRTITEILASPYPIGYDVINYYLPILKNFDDHWPTISNQLPFYISLLHTISWLLHVDPRIVVNSSIVLIFGLFSVVIYSISRNLLHLNNLQSIFISIFVIFQVSVLRTTWDLHKDMFSLTITFFCLLYVSRIPNLSNKMMVVIAALSTISVLADRMIGLLLTLSLIASSFVKRQEALASIAILVTIVYGLSLATNFENVSFNVQLATNNGDKIDLFYNPVNLIVLFLVLNAILLPAGLVALLKSSLTIFKIPFFISLIGSFSWLLFPNTSAFLPDRWITIFSIFLSLFSGYGFVLLIENKRIAISHKKLNNYLVILIPFVFLGSAFAMSPNGSYLNVYGVFHPYISHYGPLTMQYNSISLPESESLLSLIEWINNENNTSAGSTIMGSKHLRGWMELELENRSFLFSDNITDMLNSNKYAEFYLLNSSKVEHQLQNYSSKLSYNNSDFSLYHLKRIE